MGLANKDYQCPGCAETINVGGASQCPLCDTPILKNGAKQLDNAILCRHCKANAPLDSSTCPSCGIALASSGGVWILIPMLFLFFIFGGGILAAIAVPNFSKARAKANKRACFANQKTIAGATEMYDLDYNTDTKKLSPAFINTLVKDGYLQSPPKCPGNKQGGTNYLMDSSYNVTCKTHGSVSGNRYQVENR